MRLKNKLDKLPEDIAYVFHSNLLDRHVNRPDTSFQNSKYAEIYTSCFVEFLAYYYIRLTLKEELENDCDHVLLDDEVIESCHLDSHISEK